WAARVAPGGGARRGTASGFAAEERPPPRRDARAGPARPRAVAPGGSLRRARAAARGRPVRGAAAAAAGRPLLGATGPAFRAVGSRRAESRSLASPDPTLRVPRALGVARLRLARLARSPAS